jgi:hypothetical protein
LQIFIDGVACTRGDPGVTLVQVSRELASGEIENDQFLTREKTLKEFGVVASYDLKTRPDVITQE